MASVVALGNFDGLHRGHMTVLNDALAMAKRKSAMPFALVFKEHPQTVLTGKEVPCLFTSDMRAAAFKKTGVTLCLLEFSELKDMSPKEFFDEIIIKRMGAVGVCCGFNYNFGKGGEGTPETLKKLCENAGIEFSMSPEFDYEGQPVSTTRIKKALEKGKIETANRMLGRPYSFRLQVVDGDKRGRHLDAPTINQKADPHIVIPKYGVYMSKATVGDRSYLAITNIGVRPTFYEDAEPSIETHILDFEGDLYGKFVEIALLRFIRPEKKFASFTDLEVQIKNDEKKVRQLAEEARNR
ncbi:MAG: bifunctional riboflavin kinase/FAD synthetase [Clostridia bacterium]|nr:bifunctional riboflavin kinase/FAD synthetase [Clostridia bacterium]